MELFKLLKRWYHRYKVTRYKSAYPPGHPQSPIIKPKQLDQQADWIWGGAAPATVDLNTEVQLAQFEKFSSQQWKLPYTDPAFKGVYTYENEYFSYTDANVLFLMMAIYRPSRIIEIDGGHSTAAFVDAIRYLGLKTKLLSIDLFPDRVKHLLRGQEIEGLEFRQGLVQGLDMKHFRQLAAGDILFIDASHTIKTGSDLHYLFFHVFPALASGVLIHFHDVFYPFEYPRHIIDDRRNWNEIYLLHAFLMYNSHFEIIAFNDYLHQQHPAVFSAMPNSKKDTGGSIWLRRV